MLSVLDRTLTRPPCSGSGLDSRARVSGLGSGIIFRTRVLGSGSDLIFPAWVSSPIFLDSRFEVFIFKNCGENIFINFSNLLEDT